MHTLGHGGVIQPLTDTQRRILSLIGTGMSNQQVADELFITVGTTKWHLNQIYRRLQARNRTEAVAGSFSCCKAQPARKMSRDHAEQRAAAEQQTAIFIAGWNDRQHAATH
jgi:DNA-binding CsgD family transcriptional regulator